MYTTLFLFLIVDLSLNVRRTRLSTVGDQAFPVAAARTWNSLLQHVTSTPSIYVCLFSEVASRLSSSGVHSHGFYRTFVVPAQWQPSFSDTLIVLFYLLTYWVKIFILGYCLSAVHGNVDCRSCLRRLFLRFPSSEHCQQQPTTTWSNTGCHTKRSVQQQRQQQQQLKNNNNLPYMFWSYYKGKYLEISQELLFICVKCFLSKDRGLACHRML